jgi:hypothetical protein
MREQVGIGAQFGDDERQPLHHQTENEIYIVRQPAEQAARCHRSVSAHRFDATFATGGGAPTPGTTSTAAPTREWRPRRGDGSRPFEGQLPGSCRSLAEHVEPWRFCDQHGSDRRRPQHVAARGQLHIQRSTTAFASARAAASASRRLVAVPMSSPRVSTRIAAVSPNRFAS